MASRTIQSILNFRENMTQGLRRIAGQTRENQRQIRLLNNNINAFRDSAVSSFQSVAKSAGGMGLALAGIAATSSVVTAFSEAMGLEGFRMQLETATKDSKKAAEIMKWSVDLANKTPYETSSVVEASARLEAMGMSAKKFLPMVGDMAGATNKDLMQATEAIIDAQTGELERLKEFGITKAMIIKQANDKMGKIQVVNNQGQITNQEKFNEALLSLMNEMFAGGMDKQATTLKGLWSTVTGTTKTALANIVGMTNDGTIKQGSLLDMLKGKVKSVGDQFTKWQSDGSIDKIGENITKSVNVAIKVFHELSSAFKWAKDNANWLIPTISGLTAVIVAQQAVSGIVRLYQMWTAASAGLTAAQTLLNIVMAANPFGLIAIGIGLLVAAGVYLYRNWDTVREKASELWKSTKKYFVEGVNYVVDKINWLIEKLNKIPGVNIPVIAKMKVEEDATYKSGSASFATPKTFSDITKPKVPAFATGTSYFAGGLARTDEHGGEIKEYPNGTKVYPHDLSKQMVSKSNEGITVNLTIQGNVIGNKEFANWVGDYLFRNVTLAKTNA